MVNIWFLKRVFIKHTQIDAPKYPALHFNCIQGLNNTNQLANGQPGLYQQQSSTLSSNIIRVTSGQIVEIYMSQQFEGILF